MSGTCHCGEPAVAECPCCDGTVCTKHLVAASKALAAAVGLDRIKLSKTED